jgi:hypothetical protein
MDDQGDRSLDIQRTQGSINRRQRQREKERMDVFSGFLVGQLPQKPTDNNSLFRGQKP